MIPKGIKADIEELLDALCLTQENTQTTRLILQEIVEKGIKYGEYKGLGRSLEILEEVEKGIKYGEYKGLGRSLEILEEMKEYRLLIGTRGYSVCLYVDGVLRTYVQYHTDLLCALRETWKFNTQNQRR